MLRVPCYLALKAEALHLVNRTSEALAVIKEAEAVVERFEERGWSAELHRLRGMFVATLGADEIQIEASFRQAIRIALRRVQQGRIHRLTCPELKISGFGEVKSHGAFGNLLAPGLVDA